MLSSLMFRVVVSRPRVTPAVPCAELRRPDYCWTMDGEILTAPTMPCDDIDTCGCAWGFAGLTSAKACSWGVVERRHISEIILALRNGRHIGGSADVRAHAFEDLRDINERLRHVRVGTVLGIWSLGEHEFSLYSRTKRRARRRAPASRLPLSS